MRDFPCGSADKESACNVGDLGLNPGLGRSPGEGKDAKAQRQVRAPYCGALQMFWYFWNVLGELQNKKQWVYIGTGLVYKAKEFGL